MSPVVEGPGVYDVCEKDPVNAMEYMTAQQREDITASAQVDQCRHHCHHICLLC